MLNYSFHRFSGISEKITQLFLPLGSILGGLILGIIFEKIILRKLKKIALKTKWEGDEIVISSLRGMLTFGLFLRVFTVQSFIFQ